MKRTARLPELLAPAGSPEAFSAALAAGADAVYLGGSAFHARAGAANFTDAALAAAVQEAHAYGVRVYVALNTLLYDRELGAFLSYADGLERMGVDAVIVADRGAMQLLATYLPALPIHASTQASAHSLAGVEELFALGARRVVPARELALSDIKTLVAHSRAEIEVFLHGALCVSYSGQCLFSSLVGGRSGNRGECAQPCRLPYNGAYPISLRDLSLAAHVPALIESGVASLKIEGRLKSPSYVYGVTAIYRRLLDEGRAATAEEEGHLRDLFSRGGFTDAYFTGHPAAPMVGRRSEQDKQNTRALGSLSLPVRKIPLRASARFAPGQPATMTLQTQDGRTATVTGAVPAPAENAPLCEEGLRARLAKTGGTPYTLAPGDIALDLAPDLFLAPGAVNALRRAALAALAPATRPVRPPLQPPLPLPHPVPGAGAGCTALCYTAAQAAAVLSGPLAFDAVFLPLDVWQAAALKTNGIYVPPVVQDHEEKEILAALAAARGTGARYALCGHAGLVPALQEMGYSVLGDFRLNVTNAVCAAYWQERGLCGLVLSPELALPQLRDIGYGSVIVYGRIPLMLTERCFMRENFGCEACGRAALRDRRDAAFPLLREYPHRNIICNSLPTYMGDRQAALSAYGAPGQHFIFTVEGEGETAAVLSAYYAGRPLPGPVRRISATPAKKEKKA